MASKSGLKFMLVCFLSCSLLRTQPAAGGPLPKEDASVIEKSKPWKICPTYGSFYGDLINDFGCCLDENTCSTGSVPLAMKEEGEDMSKLLLRSKRSLAGDLTRDNHNKFFVNTLYTRNAEEDSKRFIEVSLCETTTELLRPVYGSVFGTNKRVQIYQFKPFLIQTVLIEKCVEKQTLLINGECRQKYEPQEMFIVSPNSTLGDFGGIGVDRVFMAVPTGCSTFIDSTQLVNILNLKKEANSNKEQALFKSTIGTQVNYQTYSVSIGDSIKPIAPQYQDMTINDQPSGSNSDGKTSTLEEEVTEPKLSEAKSSANKSAAAFSKLPSPSPINTNVNDEENLINDNDSAPQLAEEKGWPGAKSNEGRGIRINNQSKEITTTNFNLVDNGKSESDGKRVISTQNAKEGSTGGNQQEIRSDSSGNGNDGPGNQVQTLPIPIEVPVRIRHTSLDPLNHLKKNKS